MMLKLLLLFMMFVPQMAVAIEYEMIADAYENLKKEAKHERPVIEDEYQRERIVKHFVKRLAKLDDEGLGDARLKNNNIGDKLSQENLIKIKRLAAKVQDIVGVYQKSVKPILLNNVKFKRKDFGASINKSNLAQLFFKTRYNYHTGRAIYAIFHRQQDVSDSIFSEKMVDAGILANFPSLEKEQWVKDALDMELELITFLRLHRAYQDGVGVRKPKKKKVVSKTSAITLPTQVGSNIPNEKVVVQPLAAHKRAQTVGEVLPSAVRAMLVQKFVWSFTKLDEDQDWLDFRAELKRLVEKYEQKIKPILVNNINLRRKDPGARANRGALIALFYPNRSNHKTGKPISGKLKYEKDVSGSIFSTKMEEVGLLVEHPELAQDDVIQRALTMESELEVLFKEHRGRIKSSGDTFLD